MYLTLKWGRQLTVGEVPVRMFFLTRWSLSISRLEVFGKNMEIKSWDWAHLGGLER